jgi:hypothetical protein
VIVVDEDESELELELEDAGLMFRTEMATKNAFMGYWKHLLTVLVVVLLSILFYGQYKNWHQTNQRDLSHAMFVATKDLAMDPSDEELGAAAAKLQEIGEQGRGLGAVDALLKSAELYRNAGNAEGQGSALVSAGEKASGTELVFLVESQRAMWELESGDGDAAVSRLRSLVSSTSGLLGLEARMSLASALEATGAHQEARSVYETLLADYPDTTRKTEVEGRVKALPKANG